MNVAQCSATGEGLRSAVAGVPAIFYIQCQVPLFPICEARYPYFLFQARYPYFLTEPLVFTLC